MTITVHYLAQLRRATGTASEKIDLDAPTTLAALLAVLVRRHGQSLQSVLIDDRGALRPTILAFVNDQQAGRPEEVLLRERDSVTFLFSHRRWIVFSDNERKRYEWQLWVSGFGEAGQERLKSASVLVSRCGGVGGLVAYELAAAGIGRLVLAHAGAIRLDDLNRQLLMTTEGVGQPRMDIAPARLRELNPDVVIEAVAENISADNAERLVGSVDLVVSCAPVFRERLLMNREAVRQNKPLVDCAMYELEGSLTTVLPGRSPCLACLYPVEPPGWQRTFPVFGAVAGMVACLGAMEAIKILAGLGTPLAGEMLRFDLGDMSFRKLATRRWEGCPVCGRQVME